MKLSDSLKNRFPSSNRVLLDDLSKIINALSDNSQETYPFHPTRNLVQSFNSYIDFAISVYLDKFKQLYMAVAESLEREWYLVYAQSGRSILENAATFRYYTRQKELSSMADSAKTSLNESNLNSAIQTLDRFIRGNKFSWDTFFDGRFEELTKNPHQEQLNQINVKTCLDKWYKDTPKLENLYDLFCDLVHPNLGSNFLVMKTKNGELVAGGKEGKFSIMSIICPTLAGIIGAYKDIQDNFFKLEGMKLP